MTEQRAKTCLLAALLASLLAGCGGSTGPSTGQPQAQFGTISGTVTEDGQAVAGATLDLSRAGHSSRSAASSATGTYQFNQVEVGTWTLVITPPDGFDIAGAGTQSVTVAANQTASVNFQLQRIDSPPITGTAEIAMMAGNTFSPPDVTVAPGTTVRWRNEDNLEHNATGAGNAWASPLLAPGATFERQFDEVGAFNYTCTLHAGMSGVIRVQEP